MGEGIGFIGTGTIASAIVTGMCSEENTEHSIYLSPRNPDKSKELAKKFDNVEVANSNQEVIDRSEWIVISVVPQRGEEVLRSLNFTKDHRVINLMSNRKLPEIAHWIGETRSLIHMIPLPFIAKRVGPIVIYPEDDEVLKLFSNLGEVIAVDSAKKAEALAAITALMSPYYRLLWEVVNWGNSNGLSNRESRDYTAAFFESLSYNAYTSHMDLKSLTEEMTPGGINEIALSTIIEQDGYIPWLDALDLAMERLGKSSYDG